MTHLEHSADQRGGDDLLQQTERAEHADQEQAAWRAWLADFIKCFSAAANCGPLRILDYGCGLGRSAPELAGCAAIDYVGFDCPASATDLRLCADSRVEAAFVGGEKFDLIVTMSVLTRHPPQAAKSMIDSMLARLAPGGRIVLVENTLTAVSAIEDIWGDGGWRHAFPRHLEGRADVEITDSLNGRGAAYVIHPMTDGRPSRYQYRASLGAPPEALDLSAVLVRGLDRAEVHANQVLAQWTAFLQEGGDLVGRVRDLEDRAASHARREADTREALAQADEKLEIVRREAEAQRRSLSTALHQASDELAASRSRFMERQRMLEDVAQAAQRVRHREAERRKPAVLETGHAPSSTEIEWNAPRDVRYSREIPGLETILHVFHKEWFGIRAASGSLPGDKAAITANRALSPAEIAELHRRILEKNYKRIVFHGCSRNTTLLVEYFSAKGLSASVYVIVHGSPAQWNNDLERNLIFDHIDLLKLGKIRRLHIMKAGFEFPSANTFKPLVLNLSPKIESQRAVPGADQAQDRGIVLAPGWSTWQKNLYGSVIAASMCDKVRRVWIYEKNFSGPPEVMQKVSIQKYLSREQTFDLMAMSSICLNASLLDCHPMVNIEAQALGRACIRGPLNLDALEDHPYVRLTNVANVASMSQIKTTIDKVLSVPSEELTALAQDYQTQSDAVASSRHLEFLEF